MKRYVVDASVAVKWVVPEDRSDRADRLLAAETDLLAPDLLLIEAANALWKKVSRREIVEEEAGLALDALFESPLELVPTRELLRRALDLAGRLRHPVYDCAYLALAEREAAVLVTDDGRVSRIARRAGVKARALRAV